MCQKRPLPRKTNPRRPWSVWTPPAPPRSWLAPCLPPNDAWPRAIWPAATGAAAWCRRWRAIPSHLGRPTEVGFAASADGARRSPQTGGSGGPVPHPRGARHRRHGRGLRRLRRAAAAAGGAQAAAPSGPRRRSHFACGRDLDLRGPGAGPAPPSQRRDPVRGGAPCRNALPGARAGRRGDPARVAARAAPYPRRDPGGVPGGGLRAGSSPRRRHRSPRLQAGQRAGGPRRPRAGGRLRAGDANGIARAGHGRPGRPATWHPSRRGASRPTRAATSTASPSPCWRR